MASFLQQLALLVGAANVAEGDSEAVRAASSGTFVSRVKILGIVRPASVSELVECLRLAASARTALYPISGGKNWGYGSRTPPRSDNVIVDLSRLNRIVDCDETLGYVTVECGVTFGQLASYLYERGAGAFASMIGGPPRSSLIGNLVERGIGKGPLADRFLHACDFQVVLPTGEVVTTGFGRHENARAAAVHRWGVGPSLEGLFTQSNLGIVTRATVWLRPKPAFATSFLYRVDDDASLAPLINALQLLRAEGTLTSSVLVGNDVRRLSFAGQYPWAEMNGVTPISREVRARLARSGRWSGDGTVYAATQRIHDAVFDRVSDILHGVGATVLRQGDTTSPLVQSALSQIHDLALGTPLQRSVETAYFRKRTPPPADLDPDRDGCGFISFSPAIPFSGDAAREAADLIEDIFPRFGFDPNIGFNCVADRSIDMTPMLLFDRDIPGEDERAEACHRAAFEAFAARGYYPYRLTTQSMSWLPSDNAFVGLVRRLKLALDPANVLAPGRYDFTTDNT